MSSRNLLSVAGALAIVSKLAVADAGIQQFQGLDFGVGISLTHDLGKHQRISDASVVNGVVRVNQESDDIPRVMLESHYFFTPDGQALGLLPATNAVHDAGGRMLAAGDAHLEWGIGPFVAIVSGTNDIIDAVAMGVMLGFKRNNDPKDHSSWNIGIGAAVDPSVKVLGEGLEPNRALPTGETAVRYRTTSQWGVVGLVSFAF